MTSPVLSVLLSTLVSTAPIAGPADAPANPSSATGGSSARGAQATREEQAFQLYQAGRFAEAGIEFEALWADFADPRYLYNAASSRFAVGHFAHAADYLARYLETPGLAADDRGDASGQLAAARGHLVELQITVTGPTEGASLSVEHIPELASDLRPPLAIRTAFGGTGGEGNIALDPGQWRVRLRAADGREVAQEIELRKGPSKELTLDLPEAEDPPEDPPSMRPYALGFGVGGGGVALVGLGLTIGTQVRANRLLTGNEACANDPSTCRERVVRNLNARAWGTGLLGLGLGSAAGGLTGLISDPKQRRTVWIAEAATGGALVIAGTASVFLGARISRGVTSPSDATWNDLTAWSAAFADEGAGGASLHSVGGLLLGLGAGLTTSSITALVLQRSGERRSRKSNSKARVDVGASLSGIVLSGSF